jgi:hypothetical protein
MPPPSPDGKPSEGVYLGATAVTLLAVVLTVAACARDAASVPTGLPADALPGMQSEVAVLGAAALARDALDPAGLEKLLGEVGYVSGRQRTFSGPGERFSLAITRVLVFESADGAGRYVSWLRAHPEDLLGKAQALEPLNLPGSPFLMIHLPGGCCPKAVPIYLSAWRRGHTVLFLKASGRQADVGAVEDLAEELDVVVGDRIDA